MDARIMDLSEIEDILERMARMDKRSYKRKPKAIDFLKEIKAGWKEEEMNGWAERLHNRVKAAESKGKNNCVMIKMGKILS